MRIVSLLPSATEMICELGLRDSLVGVTHECDHPASVADLPAVTRTLIPPGLSSSDIDRLVREQLQTETALYHLRGDVLEKLCPDLIVTQALCDVCAVAESEVRRVVSGLQGSPRVINLEPNCLADVFDCIIEVGKAAKISHHAESVVNRLKDRVESVGRRTEQLRDRTSVVFLEWIDPPFSAGHWSPELVRLAGGQEMIGNAGHPSRTVSWEEVVAADPECIVIACCGFDVPRTLADIPTLQRQPNFENLRCVRDDRIYVMDGNAYFNRPGPRLVDSLELLAHAFHPMSHPLPEHLDPATRVGNAATP
ncbi:MAG: cobalamin-binding protein [Planctomycetota bacterium]